MGYYTKYNLDFTQMKGEKKDYFKLEEEIAAALKEINPDYFGDCRYYGLDSLFEKHMKWYESHSDILDLSEKFPGILFELSGEGEDSDDIWKAFFYEGVCQHCLAQIVYDPVNYEYLGIKKEDTLNE